jgi:hypothetical protein
MGNSHNMEDYDLRFNKHCNQLRKIISLIIPTLKFCRFDIFYKSYLCITTDRIKLKLEIHNLTLVNIFKILSYDK